MATFLCAVRHNAIYYILHTPPTNFPIQPEKTYRGPYCSLSQIVLRDLVGAQTYPFPQTFLLRFATPQESASVDRTHGRLIYSENAEGRNAGSTDVRNVRGWYAGSRICESGLFKPRNTADEADAHGHYDPKYISGSCLMQQNASLCLLDPRYNIWDEGMCMPEFNTYVAESFVGSTHPDSRLCDSQGAGTADVTPTPTTAAKNIQLGRPLQWRAARL